MIGDNFVEAKEKAELEVMDEFVDFLHENTGVYGNESRQVATVHIGGRSCVYSPETSDMARDKSPVMRHLEKNDNLRIRRNSVVTVGAPGGPKKIPRLTIEVVGDGN